MIDAPKIYLIDDDDAVLKSIRALLSAHGFAAECFSSAWDFLSQKARADVGVLITDLSMPGTSGLELLEILTKEGSALSVIVVTGVADVQSAVRIMGCGAITLLEKPFSGESLLSALQLGIDQSRTLYDQKMERQSISQKLAGLSKNELEVLEGMITGRSVKSCANKLQLSTRTVERHRKTILESFKAASIPELAVMLEKSRSTR